MKQGFEKYAVVPKIQKSLNVLADVYEERIRRFIMLCYTDKGLESAYKMMRKKYEDDHHLTNKLGKGEANRREILLLPNGYVADFVDRVMTAKHGPFWVRNKKYYKDDLIRPWLVIPEKLL